MITNVCFFVLFWFFFFWFCFVFLWQARVSYDFILRKMSLSWLVLSKISTVLDTPFRREKKFRNATDSLKFIRKCKHGKNECLISTVLKHSFNKKC